MIVMTLYQFVYGKTCHLLVELEHKAYWAIKDLNLDIDAARIKRRIQISGLEELRLKAYHNASKRQSPTIQSSIQGLWQRKTPKQMGWIVRRTFSIRAGKEVQAEVEAGVGRGGAARL
jgi:hypothetical protein